MKGIICFGLLIVSSVCFLSCQKKNALPSEESINEIDLKRGNVVMCATADNKLGTVTFETSCSEKVKKDFDMAIALLHSFEYDEAEKVFAKIIDEERGCAMAYWGVAMSNYHQLWPSPPSPKELEKGFKAITIAQAITQKAKRESDYIDAIATFYNDWEKADHRNRSNRFELAMEKLYTAYPDDKEAAIFYALALDGAADPADKTFHKQKKAGAILTSLNPGEPDHPGIVHYIIHSYDSPELANLALPAARKYASIAPASSHAQHMPSHIFTRLGLWDECIQSNLDAMESAKCYAENVGIKGHWDEELHALDYLVYAYLQKGENDLVKQQRDYLLNMKEVYPANFKVAYAFAAIPSRYVLENKMWNEAATLKIYPDFIAWDNYPWQKAIFHFARLIGAVHLDEIKSARAELENLNKMHTTLINLKDAYKANQVMIQMKTAEAWILFKEGKTVEALQTMNMAADMEDKTEKSPVTPGEVIPAKELLGDMLLELNRPAEALEAYEADLKKHPYRFNGLYGAGLAGERLHNHDKARFYYSQLTQVANSADVKRPELKAALLYLKKEI